MLVEKAREEKCCSFRRWSNPGQPCQPHIKPSCHPLFPLPPFSNFGCLVVSAVPTPAANTEVAVLVLNCCQFHWQTPGTPHPISWQLVPLSTPSTTPCSGLGAPDTHQGLSWSCPRSQRWEWSCLTEYRKGNITLATGQLSTTCTSLKSMQYPPNQQVSPGKDRW